MTPKPYDTTVARIAGNIASGLATRDDILNHPADEEPLAQIAVRIARLVIAEVQRTEPEKASEPR
jgi:hypothetical protein